jgi:hypothetical protein
MAHFKAFSEGITLAKKRPHREAASLGITSASRRSAVVNRLAAVILLALSVATTAANASTSICGGTSIPIDTSVLNKPFANLTLGGSNGMFLIDTGATRSQIDMRRYDVPKDSKISLTGFSLPSVQDGVFIAADLRSFAAPLVGQLGVVGTDFLSQRSIEFQYGQGQPFISLGREACDPAALRRAGFVSVGLPGYYDADSRRLKRGMPNVPVISLRVGPITFPSQIDTGYGDLPQGVVQVNAALISILRESGMRMHSLPSDVVTLSCSGTYAYERWQVEDQELSVISLTGDTVASYPTPLLEVKTDTHCSGISTLADPFAQIGAFWLSRWGKSVFDGLSATVWIPTNP